VGSGLEFCFVLSEKLICLAFGNPFAGEVGPLLFPGGAFFLNGDSGDVALLGERLALTGFFLNGEELSSMCDSSCFVVKLLPLDAASFCDDGAPCASSLVVDDVGGDLDTISASIASSIGSEDSFDKEPVKSVSVARVSDKLFFFVSTDITGLPTLLLFGEETVLAGIGILNGGFFAGAALVAEDFSFDCFDEMEE